MKYIIIDEWGQFDEAEDGTDEGCGDMVLDKLNEMEESKEKEPIRFELKPRAFFFDIFK